MFEAKITLDNGLATSRKFNTYPEMLNWLAWNPDAGIEAWEDSEAIEQGQLQTDVQQYL